MNTIIEEKLKLLPPRPAFTRCLTPQARLLRWKSHFAQESRSPVFSVLQKSPAKSYRNGAPDRGF
jgi:hypothetical protein